MRKKLKLFFALLLLCTSINAQQLAFPDAQGCGRYAIGGRMGTVYHVTNLNDSGTGSLRDAVSQPNRIVVFDVSGIINISSRIVFSKNLYVAGQTAPGEGVTVYGDGVSFSGADNIIVRYMRFRMGAIGSDGKDAGGIANGKNMIFDHCSFSWGRDENFSINYDNKGTAPQNITLMNSIVGQGLMTHSAGGLMQADSITLYRILLVDNSTRNFKVKGINQYVNNIVYNWKNAAYNMGGDSEGTSYANIESNLFINGPAVGGNCLTGGNTNFHFYGVDNWQDSNRDGVYNPSEFTGDGGGDRQTTPYQFPILETWKANELIEKLLPDVGASLPYRDLADCYMIDEVLSFGKKGKLITNENELPIGTPATWSWFKGTKPVDSDNDGMPDTWESANGLNPNDASDAMQIATNGYANIENYLNSITKADRQFFLRAPQLLELTNSTTNSLSLSWADYSDNEEGFIVEMKKDDNFTEMGRTTGNTFTIENANLTPGTAYVVRVCAYQGDTKSEYTTELTVKTRPEQADIIDAEKFQGTGEGEWLINSTSDQTYTLNETKDYKAVVVRSDAHVTINGTGSIGGPASLNKTGNGTLTVASDQQYEGATVLHKGTYEFETLKDGGIASGLGKSMEFAQNWIMDGGIYKYTGTTTSTNRSAKLYNDTELNIAEKNAVVTMNGSMEGQGTLTINGEGQILVNTANFFMFDGDLVMKGGSLKLATKTVSDKGIGTAGKLVLAGGEFITIGKNESSTTYNFPIEAVAGTTSLVSFDLWNTNKCKVYGTGTLIWDVHYLREYIEGNWDSFTGKLIIKGTGSSGKSQFAIRNGVGVRNATINLTGNAEIHGAKNESTFYLGGLSGDSGTKLSGFNVKQKGSGTWVVGGANTDETFNGVIDNYDQNNKNNGTTSIEKQGTGEWRLTGKNIYSGKTTITKGTLIVNGNHTGTGAISVASNATLAGSGSLAGVTTLNSGAILQIGDSLANDKGLTFKGNVILQEGAILRLNEAMQEATHYNGDMIQAFTANGTVTGTFAQIIPAAPGEGQTWDTSELYTNGVLKVVGGKDKPEDPDPVEPQPSYETIAVCLAYGNMTPGSYDNSGINNMLVGEENKTNNGINNNNIGFSLVCTGNLTKSYSKDSGGKMTYNFDGVDRTGIVLSNGAQNTIFMPENAQATKLTLWSVTGSNTSSRTSFWKEIAGQEYTESTASLLDLNATRSAPNKREFTLNNVTDAVTFTNTGEQQIVIIVMEYLKEKESGINIISSSTPMSVKYYTLSGECVTNIPKGIYIMRAIMQDGRIVTRKLVNK